MTTTASEKPPYAPGDKLVLAAPAHTGLPAGATAIVSHVLPRPSSGDEWCFAVTLTGGGPAASHKRVCLFMRIMASLN